MREENPVFKEKLVMYGVNLKRVSNREDLWMPMARRR
jgi:hypothetical protein